MRCTFCAVFFMIFSCSLLFCQNNTAPHENAYTKESLPYASYLPDGKLVVIVTFDGSYSLSHWKSILSFAKKNNAKFTFFVSGVYFLPTAQASTYCYPPDPSQTGKSDIGFGGSVWSVQQREKYVLTAVADGHDIESHLNGHFDSAKWTTPQWSREFEQFDRIMSFLPQSATCVRVPLLATNKNIYPVMAARGMKCITSTLDKDYSHFQAVTENLNGSVYTFYEFPIPRGTIHGEPLILMDYNFYLYDSKHKIDSKTAEKTMTDTYLAEAKKCYAEKRPLFINNHFSSWNNSAYWNSMEDIIETVSKTYSVEYMTISELCNTISKQNSLSPKNATVGKKE